MTMPRRRLGRMRDQVDRTRQLLTQLMDFVRGRANRARGGATGRFAATRGGSRAPLSSKPTGSRLISRTSTMA